MNSPNDAPPSGGLHLSSLGPNGRKLIENKLIARLTVGFVANDCFKTKQRESQLRYAKKNLENTVFSGSPVVVLCFPKPSIH